MWLGTGANRRARSGSKRSKAQKASKILTHRLYIPHREECRSAETLPFIVCSKSQPPKTRNIERLEWLKDWITLINDCI
jgi:hypothetical protein